MFFVEFIRDELRANFRDYLRDAEPVSCLGDCGIPWHAWRHVGSLHVVLEMREMISHRISTIRRVPPMRRLWLCPFGCELSRSVELVFVARGVTDGNGVECTCHISSDSPYDHIIGARRSSRCNNTRRISSGIGRCLKIEARCGGSEARGGARGLALLPACQALFKPLPRFPAFLERGTAVAGRGRVGRVLLLPLDSNRWVLPLQLRRMFEFAALVRPLACAFA